MRAHVFAAKPKFCLAMRPGIVLVRCPKCGHPHEEYLGPRDRDEASAQLAFYQREYQNLAAILSGYAATASQRRPVRRR